MDQQYIDEAQLRALYAAGHSQAEIARQLGIPPSTLRDKIKALGLTRGAPHQSSQSLEELVAWWEHRKATLAQASDASRETERTTFHVEKRWIDAIRRQADLDHLTITQVVNRAFETFFTEK